MNDNQITNSSPDTHQKALEINLDTSKYGTLAEIGAGQEIAAWLFRVGGASGTIAKTMSAYDMQFSDAIYGKSERYVSKQRLNQMLDHEYELLIERLSSKRKDTTTFFALADTISARNYVGNNVSHGWIGVRFQAEVAAEANTIILHVNLLEKSGLLQQKTVGIFGINLLYAAFNYYSDRNQLIDSLLDNLSLKQIEVDYIDVNGPVFKDEHSQEWGIELLKRNLAHVILCEPSGELTTPAEAIYKRPLVLQRGSLNRELDFHGKVLRSGIDHLKIEPNLNKEPLGIFEMTVNHLLIDQAPDTKALCERMDKLRQLGWHVMISNYAENYHLTNYLNRYTKESIRFTLGVSSLLQVFQEKYYSDLAGGILEALGRLMASNVKMYVFPMKISDVTSYLSSAKLDFDLWEMPLSGIVSLSNIKPVGALEHLFNFLLHKNAMVEMKGIE
jgi:hypothetical protein